MCVCAAPKFMEALKDEGVVDEESLSEAHLSAAYSKLQEQVADNVAKQNQIMPRVEVRGGVGGEEKEDWRGGEEKRRHESVCMKLLWLLVNTRS